jgi:hypothetical protein
MTTLSAPMTRRIALITTVLTLAFAAPALAQTDAFGPLPQAAPTAAPTAAATVDPAADNTGRNTLFLIGGLLIVGFGVMGWFIMRDARAALPEEELAGLGRLRSAGPHAHKREAKARARKRAKLQKQARRKNR